MFQNEGATNIHKHPLLKHNSNYMDKGHMMEASYAERDMKEILPHNLRESPSLAQHEQIHLKINLFMIRWILM